MSESKMRTIEEAIEAENTAAAEKEERDRLYEQITEQWKKARENPEMWLRATEVLEAWAKAHNKFVQASETAENIRQQISLSNKLS